MRSLLGVVSAFLSSTIFVSAFTIVFSRRSSAGSARRFVYRPSRSKSFVCSKNNRSACCSSPFSFRIAVYGAASLETDFDLADFVNEDMAIMGVRDELADSYERRVEGHSLADGAVEVEPIPGDPRP